MCLIKDPKSKFSWRACPRTPLVCHDHTLHTDTYLPPPPIISIPPSFGQKAEQTLVSKVCIVLIVEECVFLTGCSPGYSLDVTYRERLLRTLNSERLSWKKASVLHITFSIHLSLCIHVWQSRVGIEHYFTRQ